MAGSGDTKAPYAKAFRSLKNVPFEDRSQKVKLILDSLGYHQGKLRAVDDTLFITPGKRVSIKGFSIEAPSSVSFENTNFPSFPRPYDAGEIREMVQALSRSLADQGYPFSRVITSIDSTGPGVLEILFGIEPDTRTCNSAPVVKGIKGKRDLFLRDILIREGELFRAADVSESLRRLRLRPYVTEAGAGSPVLVNGSPLESDTLKAVAVPFTITERSGMDVEGALGYESGSAEGKGALRGVLNLSMINLFHTGENAKIHYIGAQNSQRLKVSFEKPWIAGMPLFAGGALGLEVEDLGYGYLSGELSTGIEIGGRWKGSFTLRGSETVPPDSLGSPYKFYGADIAFSLISRPYSRGNLVKELSIRTGSGVADRETAYTRNRMEIEAGIHAPFGKRYAFLGRIVTENLFTDEENLSPAEHYRTGGSESLRGYSEDEFSFRSVAYIQTECLLYFNKNSSLFIFLDGGTGFDKPGSFSLADRKDMLGYGVGVRFPSKLGSVTLEWGRNIHDSKSAGRVHLGIQTVL
ncbi:MAG: BamA/TamA family outer membrane protein [Chitinispirillaceae bacterium]